MTEAHNVFGWAFMDVRNTIVSVGIHGAGRSQEAVYALQAVGGGRRLGLKGSRLLMMPMCPI